MSQDWQTEQQLERLTALYGIQDEDLELVRIYGRIVVPQLEDYVQKFYKWLEPQYVYTQFFLDRDRLQRVQQ